MAVQSAQTSVGTSPTLMVRADADGERVVLYNPSGTNPVYLGGASVTTGDGYRMPAGDKVSVTLGAGEELYAVATLAGESLHVLRTGA